MKKTLTTIAAALIMMTTFSAFAIEKSNPLKKFDSTSIVTIYLESVSLGNPSLNKFIFADNFEYQNTANNDSFNKKQYLKFLKQSEGAKFNCDTTYEILDQSGKTCIAKVSMIFDQFTRVDYITLNQSEDGWKVSKVVTTYPQ
ncbi:nuclear transport factor 2 family protein [Sphingobacterium oryzagri]|uniref:Nuclear transport factor 2 family protein n=1 Tax=Sphingobacterium oryzagri TaxID=3025669 RepID=A0ABY7WHE0_9SPHI|nr:nuclear transport factor 2 family protein [Sphingobacterium sp. KACC 22765]WDF67690.1 nuclear transport factor 2 family protein [Sphingobacterium sp. KACC 22765]